MGIATVSVFPLTRRMHLTARRQTELLASIDVAAVALMWWLWTPPAVAVALLGAGLLILARWRLCLYRARFSLSSLDELPTALEAALIATGLLVAFGITPWLQVTEVAPSGSRLNWRCAGSWRGCRHMSCSAKLAPQ